MKPRRGNGPGGSNEFLYEIVNKNRASYYKLLKDFLQFEEELIRIKTKAESPTEDEPHWNNDFLPGLDIAALYSLLRLKKPSKYIEIGSGNSTKVARKAISDGGLSTKIISIDPFPRANIDHLSDEVHRIPIEEFNDPLFFEGLDEGDILFIDNSHRSFPNSDVTVCFLEILPRLKKGVIVHIHDIYIPYDYPQFMCDRAYSEQYLLATRLLSEGDRNQILLPNYFVSEDEELSKILGNLWTNNRMKTVERHGGSFWFTIC